MNHDAYIAATKHAKTFAEQCKSGRNIAPSYLPGTVGLKDVRLSAHAKLPIRVKTRISLSSGAADEAGFSNEYDMPIVNRRIEGMPKKRKVYKPRATGMILN